VESPLVSVFEYPAFAVQSLALYRTSILLRSQQITQKIPRISRHFLYVPLRSSWLPPLYPYTTGLALRSSWLPPLYPYTTGLELIGIR
jgi:hypothetical protein